MNREDANTILHKMSTFLDNNQMSFCCNHTSKSTPRKRCYTTNSRGLGDC